MLRRYRYRVPLEMYSRNRLYWSSVRRRDEGKSFKSQTLSMHEDKIENFVSAVDKYKTP